MRSRRASVLSLPALLFLLLLLIGPAPVPGDGPAPDPALDRTAAAVDPDEPPAAIYGPTEPDPAAHGAAALRAEMQEALDQLDLRLAELDQRYREAATLQQRLQVQRRMAEAKLGIETTLLEIQLRHALAQGETGIAAGLQEELDAQRERTRQLLAPAPPDPAAGR